jgi:hypothetical protein
MDSWEDWIDSHLRELRWMSYGGLLIGTGILLAKSRAFRRFSSLHQVPLYVPVRAFVLQVAPGPRLHLMHVPVLRQITGIFPSQGNLNLAFVAQLVQFPLKTLFLQSCLESRFILKNSLRICLRGDLFEFVSWRRLRILQSVLFIEQMY